MILSPGEKVFIVTRRHFEGDTRRHFVGVVEACTETSVRVTGHAYIANGKNGFDQKPEERTRIFSLTDGRIIVNVLPKAVELQNVEYVRILNRLHLSDGKDFVYDIDEFRSE
jgi:hypothetical protein